MFRSLLWVLPIAVAGFNLFFRLDREIVLEWDDSLYLTSAAETVKNGTWLGITFHGELDYYNTKPPLNVWMIALAFRAFGIGLFTGRLPSALAALLTVVVLMLWARRVYDDRTAAVAGLVLGTTFGFLYVHSGRSANTDAAFTLLMLLAVVVLWSARDRPWRLVWLGPIFAAVFMLRGMAVLMPLALAGPVLLFGGMALRRAVLPLAAAGVLFSLPVLAWCVARWRLDGWAFLGRMFHYDLVQRSATVLEGHEGAWYYYFNELQKNQYDWLLAAVAAVVLVPIPRRRLGSVLLGGRADRLGIALALSWVGVTLLVPTLMQTKVAWYLNPFFPIFALLVARLIVHGLFDAPSAAEGRRRALLAAVVLAFGIAEAKLLWYSYNMRDVSRSAQGLLLETRGQTAGHRVFRDQWSRADRFVLEHVAGARPAVAPSVAEFISAAAPGDYLLLPAGATHPALVTVHASAGYSLLGRRNQDARGTGYSQPLMIVSRRSKPNARSLMATIGGPCRRL